jgi:acetolactate synthase I/III small subunit
MTIVTHGDEATIEQIIKQLNKLPDVLKVQDFHNGEHVDRELVWSRWPWIPSRAPKSCRSPISSARKSWMCSPSPLTIEITGDESKMEKFLELMNTFGVQELARTGKVALPRK